MIGPQTISQNKPTGFQTGLAPGLQEPFPVRVLLEDGLAAVAPIQHMIDGPFLFPAFFARHGRSSLRTVQTGQ